MKIYFTDEEKKQKINMFQDEDIIFSGEYIEGEGKNWILQGSAIIDDEIYSDFTVEIETIDIPKEHTTKEIMEMDWEWLDYIFL